MAHTFTRDNSPTRGYIPTNKEITAVKNNSQQKDLVLGFCTTFNDAYLDFIARYGYADDDDAKVMFFYNTIYNHDGSNKSIEYPNSSGHYIPASDLVQDAIDDVQTMLVTNITSNPAQTQYINGYASHYNAKYTAYRNSSTPPKPDNDQTKAEFFIHDQYGNDGKKLNDADIKKSAYESTLPTVFVPDVALRNSVKSDPAQMSFVNDYIAYYGAEYAAYCTAHGITPSDDAAVNFFYEDLYNVDGTPKSDAATKISATGITVPDPTLPLTPDPAFVSSEATDPAKVAFARDYATRRGYTPTDDEDAIRFFYGDLFMEDGSLTTDSTKLTDLGNVPASIVGASTFVDDLAKKSGKGTLTKDTTIDLDKTGGSPKNLDIKYQEVKINTTSTTLITKSHTQRVGVFNNDDILLAVSQTDPSTSTTTVIAYFEQDKSVTPPKMTCKISADYVAANPELAATFAGMTPTDGYYEVEVDKVTLSEDMNIQDIQIKAGGKTLGMMFSSFGMQLKDAATGTTTVVRNADYPFDMSVSTSFLERALTAGDTAITIEDGAPKDNLEIMMLRQEAAKHSPPETVTMKFGDDELISVPVGSGTPPETVEMKRVKDPATGKYEYYMYVDPIMGSKYKVPGFYKVDSVYVSRVTTGGVTKETLSFNFYGSSSPDTTIVVPIKSGDTKTEDHIKEISVFASTPGSHLIDGAGVISGSSIIKPTEVPVPGRDPSTIKTFPVGGSNAYELGTGKIMSLKRDLDETTDTTALTRPTDPVVDPKTKPTDPPTGVFPEAPKDAPPVRPKNATQGKILRPKEMKHGVYTENHKEVEYINGRKHREPSKWLMAASFLSMVLIFINPLFALLPMLGFTVWTVMKTDLVLHLIPPKSTAGVSCLEHHELRKITELSRAEDSHVINRSINQNLHDLEQRVTEDQNLINDESGLFVDSIPNMLQARADAQARGDTAMVADINRRLGQTFDPTGSRGDPTLFGSTIDATEYNAVRTNPTIRSAPPYDKYTVPFDRYDADNANFIAYQTDMANGTAYTDEQRRRRQRAHEGRIGRWFGIGGRGR